MIPTFPSHEPRMTSPENLGWDPLETTAGVLWGTLLGGAFWAMVLALVLTS